MKFLLLLLTTSLVQAAPDCGALRQVTLPNAKIQFAADTDSTTMLGPGGFPIKTPAFCRVGGIITPSSDSEIHFEVWLPRTGWNGKFRAAGNGGFAGSLSYADMAGALRDGYATASTDTGHRANGIDAGWALGHPEKIKDFGYRAIHEMTLKAKAVIQTYYGDAPKRSYFAACSNGGRQALMEAQRYPEDYDGILAGAPANFWTHLLIANYYASGKPMFDSPASYLPKQKIPALSKAVLASCDALDGLKDSVVSDPTACHFDPATVICKGAETDNCLTVEQAATVERIYRGARDGDGKGIFFGYEPGGEDGNGGWQAWITGTKPGDALGILFSSGFQRNMVFNDPAWTPAKTNLATALEVSDAKLAADLNATDANLQAFNAHGGKLIIYHGWSDAAIPPRNAISYYDNVAKTTGADNLNSFLRLYMLPGVQHCAGGPGPNVFGQAAAFPAGDAQHDVFSALVDWVEQGHAPGPILATKFKDDNPGKGAAITRPVCAYPEKAVYSGTGDGTKPEDFHCAQ